MSTRKQIMKNNFLKVSNLTIQDLRQIIKV